MAGFKTHTKIGAVKGAFASPITYLITTKKFNIWCLFLSISIGVGGAYGTSMLPDHHILIIENISIASNFH